AKARGFLVDAVELLLGNIAVITLQLLLGAKMDTEVRQLALAALAVLAGAVFAAVERALRATPDVFAHPAVDFVLGALALAHRGFLVFKNGKRALLCLGALKPSGRQGEVQA